MSLPSVEGTKTLTIEIDLLICISTSFFPDIMNTDEDPSDTEDSRRRKHYICLVKYDATGLNDPIICPHPDISDLNACANKILDNISDVNNHFNTYHEKNYDCIAVAYTANQEIYVAANVKERYPYPTTRPRNGDIMYGELGLSDRLIKTIKRALDSQLNRNGQFKVTIVQQKIDEISPTTNARDHAEMQLLSYATENGKEISRIGISKPACVRCEEQLENHDVRFHNNEEGNQNPRNWADPEDVKTQKLTTIPKRQIRVKYHGFDLEDNIPKTNVEAKHEIHRHFKQQVIPKPGCHVTVGTILDVIEDIDRKPSAHAGTLNAYAGTYKKKRTVRIGAFARASVAEASASDSIFGASASFLSASAYAEAGPNCLAGATASLARAEAHAGPLGIGVGLNADTGVSVGVDGVQASFLGFGVAIGPKMSIKTPIFDASCSVM